MGKNSYVFLFPFEKVPRGSKIVIYGAGKMGHAYLKQLKISHYCKVLAIADRNYASYPASAIPVCSPQEINRFAFDYVVIALRSRVHENEFFDILKKQGIPLSKIIYIGEREYAGAEASIEMKTMETGIENLSNIKWAYQTGKRNIVFYLMGGIGDYILQKKVIETLCALDNQLSVDIFCSSLKPFLDFLYSDTSQVKNIYLNLGIAYDEVKCHYDASIIISGGLYLYVDCMKENCVLLPVMKQILLSLRDITKGMNPTHIFQLPAHIGFYRNIYEGETYFNHLSFHGLIPFHGWKVHIPDDAAGKRTFTRFGFRKYITVNHGNGNAHDTSKVAKCWSKERFEAVIAMIHNEYPDIKVVQTGTADADHLIGADYYIFGQSFALVSQILRHALFHIDIEGGMVHLATHMETKCIVLFGPTMMNYFGYPQNINIKAGSCHDCYGLYTDVNRCAREMEKPECMYSITPEMVMEAVRGYMETQGFVSASQNAGVKEQGHE